MFDIIFDRYLNKVIALEGKDVIGECEFIEEFDIWNIIRTEVSSSYQGKGIARKLVERVISEGNILNKIVVADCSYAKKIISNIGSEKSIDLDLIFADIERRLDISISESIISYFTDGVSGSVVFSVDGKYLVKTVDESTYKVQEEFLNIYKSKYFQKIIYLNSKLSYICFEFVTGDRFNDVEKLDVSDVIKQIYDICSCYDKYEYDGFGYLFYDYGKSWYEFLLDEVNYSKEVILDVDCEKVYDALEIIRNYDIDKYLIHGDFGVHNFLMNNNSLKVIDPMGVVGDYLYDFYFSIFSSYLLFGELELKEILSFFNREYEYKKALLLIVFYIRMSRSFKYDRSNYEKYLNVYRNL